jgi:hypothetical protein
MEMNPSVSSEALRDWDQVQEHRADPDIDLVPQGQCSNGQSPPRNPGKPSVPDEGAFQTFVGGAGI